MPPTRPSRYLGDNFSVFRRALRIFVPIGSLDVRDGDLYLPDSTIALI
jgi:hypothetical protein